MICRCIRALVLFTGLIAATGIASPAWAGPASPKLDRYDDAFRKYSKRFFGPGFDWRLFKAQAMAESNLDSKAKSPAGARGVMQLLPSTYGDIRSENPELTRIDDPDCNIAAGIYHDRVLWNGWSATSPDHRQRFTFGSYNAGQMTVQRAQRVARDRALDTKIWPSIVRVAPAVPRWRYSETFTYLSRIEDFLSQMDPDGHLK